MKDNGLNRGFVSIDNLVAEILIRIGDEEKRRYYVRTLQGVLNTIRQINLFYSKEYKEVPVSINNDLKIGAYPKDLVKLISVGIYRHGDFYPFTRRPDMRKTVTGYIDESDLGDTDEFDTGADSGIYEDSEIPEMGIKYGAVGSNMGYYVEDDENCRFFVNNYDLPKVILRYRSNGLECTKENCIPYYAKDMIIAMVEYDFALREIPHRFTAASLQLIERERARISEDYMAFNYEPQNKWEVADAIFGSYNIVPNR